MHFSAWGFNKTIEKNNFNISNFKQFKKFSQKNFWMITMEIFLNQFVSTKSFVFFSNCVGGRIFFSCKLLKNCGQRIIYFRCPMVSFILGTTVEFNLYRVFMCYFLMFIQRCTCDDSKWWTDGTIVSDRKVSKVGCISKQFVEHYFQ